MDEQIMNRRKVADLERLTIAQNVCLTFMKMT